MDKYKVVFVTDKKIGNTFATLIACIKAFTLVTSIAVCFFVDMIIDTTCNDDTFIVIHVTSRVVAR